MANITLYAGKRTSIRIAVTWMLLTLYLILSTVIATLRAMGVRTPSRYLKPS